VEFPEADLEISNEDALDLPSIISLGIPVLKDIAGIISASAAFLLIAGLLYLLIRPSSFLKELVSSFKVRRLKFRGVEAELDDGQQAKLPPDASSADRAIGLSETDESITKPITDVLPPTDTANEPEDPLFTAITLVTENKYTDALALIESAPARNDAERLTRVAFVQQLAAGRGNSKALIDLDATANSNPDHHLAKSWLATLYSERGELSIAEKLVKEAIGLDLNESERVRLVVQLSGVLFQAERFAECIDVLKAEISKTKGLEQRAILLSTLASRYRHLTPARIQIAFEMYEAAIQLTPFDTKLRFELAYAYSENSQPGMALYHYRECLSEEPNNSSALNNAGVAARELDLQGMATKYQRNAEELGSTLATSNLAFELISKGFIAEAATMLRDAQDNPEVHDRVGSAIGAIARRKGREDKMLEDFDKNSIRLSRWRVREAASSTTTFFATLPFSANFFDQGKQVNIQIDSGGHVSGSIAPPTGRRLRIEGTQEGCTILFKWEEEKANELSIFRKSGRGVFLMSSTRLVGYTSEGISLDSKELKEYLEYDLSVTQELASE
jgi:tetratricopeptide (TPR) repeat protein